jgi:beta-lactamase class A
MKFKFLHWKYVVVLVVVFVLGYGTNTLFVATLLPVNASVETEPTLRETGKYQFIAPLLLCASYENTNLKQESSLESQVQSLVDSEIRAGKATGISVYLRGFKGKWVGVNENDQYIPASLLKVPLMIAYFKEAETNPAILTKTLRYDGSFDDNQAEEFRSTNDIKPGSYKVIDLIQSMIEDSDNNATRLLDADIDPKVLASVYTDLGLTLPADDGVNVKVISAKQYSYFFRILYNATYLKPEYSEKALEFLTAIDFPQGLEATVPSNVPVANKFGERSVFTPTGDVIERDLHDCGLVYARKEGPYLLCIMTKGKNFKDLTDVIQSIGKFVYNKGSAITQ